MLEPVYRLAPDLLRSGRVSWPVDDTAASKEVRMTDFRLLRRGGFYHAVARYGPDVWTPFTYAGLHATERALRRKEQHRFWGVDCYSHKEDRYLRIGNRLFYEDPDQAVEPSCQIVVAADAWARELARSTLSGSTPTLFCTPDGQCSETVELRPSRDLVSDPAGHPTVGRPEQAGLWLRDNPDMEAIDGRTAHRLFMTICQFPAMRASWLREVVGGSSGEVSRHLGRFVQTGLVAVFDGRHYLSELGMRRAANMSRILPSVIRSRHGAYLDRWYREHEERHNDGANRLVVRFAREGVEVVAGWRGEVNVPGLTQVRPDLLVQVSGGALGAGTHYIEFERTAVRPERVAEKLGPYRRMTAAGRALPLLMVCETALGRRNFRAAARYAADADHHPGAGAGRAGDRPGYGVEPGRGAGGAALPVTSGKEQALGRCRWRLFHNRRLTPVVAPEFGHVPPSQDHPALSSSQPANLVVPAGAAWEVSNPAMRPSTSSLVSTTSRSSRPASRVRAKPRDGGVCTSRTRAFTPEASSRSNSSKVNVYTAQRRRRGCSHSREPAATARPARSPA